MPAPAMIPQRYEPDVPLDQLTPHPANPNQGDLGLLSELLAANGFAGAVLAQESSGIIVDGETRWRTALAEGMTGMPVLWLQVSDDERDRLLASINESTRRGSNDEAKLVALLTGLAQTPRGLAGAAFDGDDLDALIAGLNGPGGGGRTDDDSVPDPPDDPVTRPGDLWTLGDHRLLCGDATAPAGLARVTAGLPVPPGIIFADPPYGISAIPPDGGLSRIDVAGTRTRAKHGFHYRARQPIAGDGDTSTAAAAFEVIYGTWPAAMHIWWGANHYGASAGLPDGSCWLVWDKENGTNDFADAELAWTSHPGPVRLLRHMWNGVCRASEAGEATSPARKPVALAEWAYGVVDPKGRRPVVLDPFAGAGAALLAAHRTARICAAVELDPGNCDVICRRFEEATGITPERDGLPVTFTETAAA